MRNKRNKSVAVLLFGVLVAVLLCTIPALAQENLSGTSGPDDQAGLKGEYYDNQDLTNLKLSRTDPKVDFTWGTGSPDSSIALDTFSVRWSGQVKADHTETYTFYASTNDGVRLWVNGQQIINRWSDGIATNTGTISLQAGQWYPITMEYYEGVNMASAKLEYSSPSTPRQVVPTDHLRPETTGLKGEYYDNLDFTNLKLSRTDPTVDFDWGSASPEPSIGPETFSVRWSGQVKANYSETYTFYATGDDYVRLYVNGQLVAEKWATSLGTATGTIALQAGQWYDIKMEYGASLDNAAARLEYSSTSEPRKVIPQTQLRSPSLGEPPPPPPPAGSVTGEMKKWHPVTISFNGPPSTETNSSPNPFLDYRLQVSFTSPSGKSFEVPGFYDGDGNGGSSGAVWKVRFNPDVSGTWGYKASFRQGANVAIDTSATAGSPTSFDGASGTFNISPRDPAAAGFLSQGLLEYANGHYLKFRDGSYYLKGGADSPEDWLGYAGFDNTPTAKHSFAPHVQDWQVGDPTFNTSSADGGKGLIGALNYLSSQGINSIYFLPMNIGGDGRDSSPYVSVSNWGGSTANDNLHFDVSKLAQWEQAFAHAQKKGIMLHFVLNEAEQANKRELDGGSLGTERKLFYREMIARFGHHNALQWNISEEYESPYNLGTENVKSFAGYIQSVDPYDHPITVHNYIDPDTTWTPFLGDSRFSVTSFQYAESYAGYGAEVEEWRQKTASAGRPLPIGMDELTPATTTNATDMRKGVLWPTYLSGGNLEWYIGSEDQSLEDFRRYEQLWAYTRHARTFMEDNLPFWEMQPQDGLLLGESSDYGGGQVFTKAGEVYAVYLPNASSTGTLDLSGATGSFQKRWYNPRSGAFEGGAQAVSGGTITSLGAPPSSTSSDWVVLIEAIG